MAITITTTSIATTIITTTITPMLMTTSEPAPADAQQRDDGGRGGGAVPADDLAVAVLSGRRVLLFQRHRMGGGGRRHHRRRLAARLAGRDAGGRLRLLRRACFWRRRIAPRPRSDDAALARDRRTRGRLRALARAPARDLDAGPRLHRDRARRPGPATGSTSMVAACGGAIVYPVAVGLVSAAHAIPLAPTMHAFLHALVSNWISAGARLVPLGQTDSQRILAASKPMWSPPRSARSKPRSTISAAPPFAPISPACATRRSIRGCSGHDAHSSSSPRTQGPIATGLGCYERRRPSCLIDRSRGMGPAAIRRDDDRESTSHV